MTDTLGAETATTGTGGPDGVVVDPAPDAPPPPVIRRGWGRRRDRTTPLPPLSPGQQLARAVLVLVTVVCGCLLLQLVILSGFQQRAAQQQKFDSFRAQLAKGVAPIAPVKDDQQVLPGAAMAYLEIPAIGLRQVVVEGTTSANLLEGPGHRRDSPFPGQVGTTVIMGRRATYGAPFGEIADLKEGDAIRVTTGQGEFDYEVIGVRRENEPSPPALKSGEGRMLLVTADGRPYVPDGVLRVDADLTSKPVGGATPLFTPSTLPENERIMASDTTTVWALVLWLQVLIVAVLGFVWGWFRWGRAKAWIVGLPVLLLVGLFVADQAARLLPNLL